MFHIVAIDLYGKVIAKDTIDLDYSDTEEYYEKVANKIDEFIEEYKYQKERILGVSIATQGIISPDGSGIMYGTIMNNVKMRLSDFSLSCLIHAVWYMIQKRLLIWNYGIIRNSTVQWCFIKSQPWWSDYYKSKGA